MGQARIVTTADISRCKKHILAPSHWIPEHKLEECDPECKEYHDTVMETLKHVHRTLMDERKVKHKVHLLEEKVRIRQKFLKLKEGK